MKLMTRYKFLKLEALIENKENEYIIYNTLKEEFEVRKELVRADKYFQDLDVICLKERVLIYIQEMYESNICDSQIIKKAINNSTFSVHLATKQSLLEFISKHPSINFVEDKHKIIDFINSLIKTEVQSKKYYNNILKRLKYTCMNILEKDEKSKSDNFSQSIVERENKKNSIKMKQKDDEEFNFRVDVF